MNQLKVRASWGLNGNNSISNGAALGLMESANYSLGSLVNALRQVLLTTKNWLGKDT